MSATTIMAIILANIVGSTIVLSEIISRTERKVDEINKRLQKLMAALKIEDD